VNAGVIDSRPESVFGSGDDFNGPDTLGGSFIADANTLASFTLEVQPSPTTVAGDVFRVVVMDTVAGVPATVIWQSSDINVPAANTELSYFPGLTLIPGERYFIGIDTGVVTDTAGGSFSIGFVDGNPFPGGQAWFNFNSSGFSPSSVSTSRDIASRIEMTASPVPPGAATENFYQTTLTLDSPATTANVDQVVYNWSTETTSGLVQVSQLNHLTVDLYSSGSIIYSDTIILFGVIQPVLGNPGADVERPASDVIFDFDLDSMTLSQFRNLFSIDTLTSGEQFQIADGTALNDDGLVYLTRYVSGLVQEQVTADLEDETTIGFPLNAITFTYTDSAAFLTQIGSPTYTEDFELFTTDTSAKLTPLDVGPFTVFAPYPFSPDSRPLVDVSPFNNLEPASFGNATLAAYVDPPQELGIAFDIPVYGFFADFNIPGNSGQALRMTLYFQGGGSKQLLMPGIGATLEPFGFTSTVPVRLIRLENVLNDGFSMDNFLVTTSSVYQTSEETVRDVPVETGDDVVVIDNEVFEQVATTVIEPGVINADFCVAPDPREISIAQGKGRQGKGRGNDETNSKNKVSRVFQSRDLAVTELAGTGTCTGPLEFPDDDYSSWEDLIADINLLIASRYRGYTGEVLLPGDTEPTEGVWLNLGVVRTTAEYDGAVSVVSFPEQRVDYTNVPVGQQPACDNSTDWRSLDLGGTVENFGEFSNVEGGTMIVETAQCNRAWSLTRRTTHIFPVRLDGPGGSHGKENENLRVQLNGIQLTLDESSFCANPDLIVDMQTSLDSARLAVEEFRYDDAEEFLEEIARSADNHESFGTIPENGFAECPVDANYRGNFVGRGISAAFTVHDRFQHADAFVLYEPPEDLEIIKPDLTP